jgi:hypothetical protein
MKQPSSSFVTPGILTLVLEGILSLVIGCVIGALTLIYKEVTILRDASEKDEKGGVYYVVPERGRVTPELQQRLVAAEKAALLHMSLTEPEANIWLFHKYPRMVPLGSEEYVSEKHMSRIDIGNPQIRIEGDKLAVVGLMRTYFFNNPATDIPVQVSGHFEVNEHKAKYDVDEVYIGSLPLHKIPMGMVIADQLLALENVTKVVDVPRQFVEKAYTVVLKPEQKQLDFVYPVVPAGF